MEHKIATRIYFLYHFIQLEKFLEAHRENAGVVRACHSALKRAALNQDWRERYQGVFSEWLNEQGYTS